MAVKWTKTSSPSVRAMKPYPFSLLNHFTVPCVAKPVPPCPSGAARLDTHIHRLDDRGSVALAPGPGNAPKPLVGRPVARHPRPGVFGKNSPHHSGSRGRP